MHVIDAKPEWLEGLLFLTVVCALGGGFCLLSLPVRHSGTRRGLLRLIACVFFATALVSWSFEDHYVIVHAPRVTLTGTVTAVQGFSGDRGGTYDEFRVDTPGWEYHPFTINLTEEEVRAQILRRGDSVTMLVRTWDVQVEALDETRGSHPGWHYENNESTALNWCGALLAVLLVGYGVVKLFRDKRKRRGGDDDSDDDGDSDFRGFREREIQTIGLEFHKGP
jgi:hypothetical protein